MRLDMSYGIEILYSQGYAISATQLSNKCFIAHTLLTAQMEIAMDCTYVHLYGHQRPKKSHTVCASAESEQNAAPGSDRCCRGSFYLDFKIGYSHSCCNGLSAHRRV